MIALNELIKNKERFDLLYKIKGKSFNLDNILHLAENMKKLQLESESERAKCNKLCGTVPTKLDNKAELKSLMKEIHKLDKSSNKKKAKALKYEKIINEKLEKLDNLPDYELDTDYIIMKDGSFTNFDKFIDAVSSSTKNKTELIDVESFLNGKQNQILEEKDLPILLQNEDKFTILCTEVQIDSILNNMLKFLSSEANSVTQIATKNLKFDSSSEYLSDLNENEVLKIEVIREFWTRKFKIKYKNTNIDATKFVNQINFEIEKK